MSHCLPVCATFELSTFLAPANQRNVFNWASKAIASLGKSALKKIY